MKKILVLLLVVVFSIGCSSDDSAAGRVQIRLYNASDYTLSNLYINAGTGNKPFGSLDPAEYSDYRTLNIAFENAYMQMDVEGTTYYLTAGNFEEEEPLPSGVYTYEIHINDSFTTAYDRISIAIVEEE